MATEKISSSNSKIILNNEKFTHLLSLREILQTKSFAEIAQFCENSLLQTFNNNHKLLLNVLFHGMHKMLYNIDIKIINNFRDNMPTHKIPKIKINIKHDNKKDIENDTNTNQKVPITFCDIPYDVIKYCISKYLTISTLISLEKVSKLFLSRSRDASISLFHFDLTKFCSYKNVSLDLLRFKNTKKLSIVIENDSKYGIYSSHSDNNWDLSSVSSYDTITNSQMSLLLPTNNKNNNDAILYKQLSYFTNQREWRYGWRHLDDDTVKFTREKFNLILSQLQKYQQIKWLKFQYNGFSWSQDSTTTINKVTQNICLLHLNVLELIDVNSQFIFMKNSMNNIKQLRLTKVNLHLDTFPIMNDYMNNLESIYLDRVSITNNRHISKININKLLTKLKYLIFNDPYTSMSDSMHISDDLGLNRIISKLFINGNNNKFNDFIASPCRKNLKVLHCHSYKTVKTICKSPIYIYPNLNRLCIDCKQNKHIMVMKVISKCPKLQYLSLIIHPKFITIGVNMKDFFDLFMVHHKCIKSLRIKELTQPLSRETSFTYSPEYTPSPSSTYLNSKFENVFHDDSLELTKYVSSLFIVSFVEYVKSIISVSKWKKLSSFQFISSKKLGTTLQSIKRKLFFRKTIKCEQKLNESFDAGISNFEEEFQILNCMKDIVSDELLVTFVGVNANDFSKYDGLSKLSQLCKKEYRMKICGSNKWDTTGWRKRHERLTNKWKYIKIQIGKWNDKFHQQKFGDFDKWEHDCSRIHF